MTAWWRRRPIVIAVVAVAVLAVAGIVTGVAVSSSDDGSSTRIGAQYPAGNARAAAGAATVLLPGGLVRVSVDRTPSSGPDDERGRSVPAPDGGRFVLVRWNGTPQPYSEYFAAPGVARPVTITLVTAGRTYPLLVDSGAHDALSGTRSGVPTGGAYVAVPGAATDARVDVGYDGVVQRVDPGTGRVAKGRAAALYAPVPRENDECVTRLPDSIRLAQHERVHCAVTSQRSAYVEGLGWAPSGRVWLVMKSQLDLLLSLTHSGDGYVSHRPGTVSYRYDGRAVVPVGTGGPPGPDLGTFTDVDPRDTSVASVPAGTATAHPFTATVRTTLERTSGSGPALLPVTMTFTTAVA